MQKKLSRRDFFKFGGAAAVAAGAMQFVPTTKAFASPAPSDFGTVRFAVIADPHLDIKGKNGVKMGADSLECVKKTVAALNMEQDLTFVMVCGDLLLNGEWENARALKAELDRLKAPYMVVAGNHDFVPSAEKRRKGFTYLTIEEFVKFFEGHGYEKNGERYYSREIVPGLRVIGLDANLPLTPKKWGGVLPKEQMSWLDKELTKNKDSLHIVFIHHNIVSWSGDELKGGSKQWFCIDNAVEVRDLLAKHAAVAPMIISGHRHIALNLKELNGVNYITSPSINTHPMRYSIYDVNHTGFSWQTPSVAMETATHLEARENLLSSTGWRASQFSERNSFNDMEVLALFENNGMRMGQKKLKG
ncbi:metallophosphoesterase family protein [Maridesulfovibrio hydrothermalis]|uniref:Tat pathway signal sequence domain protein Putative Metallophosphoesterase n=1 Tax=Maridesulfovibrio hydrothermalis AM13 = DSM 14728 TaxID=1121451 RepID=L0R9L8_9BACT|nr:metallophosphoesterase [Maridesulfovibrio hydrothermalis]CCO23463.1 Tat pathway signal sequence domain protein Putative Metallophosphoesterase [Maridesulfovibrio hydrothermalis AM13 = DSM 14728]